jgi:hypothetical protein
VIRFYFYPVDMQNKYNMVKTGRVKTFNYILKVQGDILFEFLVPWQEISALETAFENQLLS